MVRNSDYHSPNKTDSATSPLISHDSFIVGKENYDVLHERYFNYETQEIVYNTKIIERELNPFDTNLSSHPDTTAHSNIFTEPDPLSLESDIIGFNNTSSEYDHLSDFTREARQQAIKEIE
jgi:hypothetical protein